MKTQAIRLSICRNPKEVNAAKDRDQERGFTVVATLNCAANDVEKIPELSTSQHGYISELYVYVDANRPPKPATAAQPSIVNPSSQLTIVVSKQDIDLD